MGHTSTAAAARRFIHNRRTPLCFTAPPADLCSATDQGVGVPRRQEVEFADGSRIWLLRVERHGVPDLFLRELGLPAGGVVVDLRKLVPELLRDLPGTSARDVPRLVHHLVRMRFRNALELIEAGVACGRPD